MPPDLPLMARVRQRITGPVVEDVAGAVTAGLRGLALEGRVRPGQTVAITGGSRGITDALPALRALVAHLGGLGAEPFVVPAMGSHGGGTAEGQRRVLASYGMTEGALGCPVRSSMEVVEVARSGLGFPLWQDGLAAAADHLVVLNRVKSHTLFSGPIESGLVKMLLIGLGNAAGAAMVHRAIMEHGWAAVVDDAAPRLIAGRNVLAGVALVERADDRTARVAVLPPERWLRDEPLLLDEARRLLPRLPMADLDLLLLDRIGKNLSGAGLDTNVVGRKGAHHPPVCEPHDGVRMIGVRGLTPETQGNAVGIGLAELCRSRVLREMDVEATRLNALTAGDLVGAMLPPDFETDRELIHAALGLTGLRGAHEARVVWARDTLHLEEVEVSEALVPEATARTDLEVIGDLRPLPLDDDGNLPDDLPEPLSDGAAAP